MSITIAAAFATITLAMTQALNIPLKFSENELTQLIMAIATAATGIIAWYGRVRHGDVTILGFRNTDNPVIESLPDDEL